MLAAKIYLLLSSAFFFSFGSLGLFLLLFRGLEALLVLLRDAKFITISGKWDVSLSRFFADG